MAIFSREKQQATPLPFGGDGINITMAQLVAAQQLASTLDLTPHSKRLARRSGQYVSQLKGRGMEFSEVRQYQPTDDVRSIDWRVTARTGKPHTKVYREERERPVLISVDLSPEMFFGSQLMLKSVQACHLAAAFAWRAYQLGDRVGGLLHDGQTLRQYVPKAQRRGVLPLLKGLCDGHQQALQGSDISLTAHYEQLLRLAKPGSVVIVIGDFMRCSAHCEQVLRQLTRHCQLILCRITDPLEQQLPTHFHQDLDVTDGQQRQGVLRLSQRRARRDYQQRLADQNQRKQQQLQSLTRNVLAISSAQPLAQQLQTSRGRR